MQKLIKYTLDKNKKTEKWELTNDKTDEVVKTFKTKTAATAGGVLKKAIGEEGGSVKIKLENNKIQEERTYPQELDPRESRG